MTVSSVLASELRTSLFSGPLSVARSQSIARAWSCASWKCAEAYDGCDRATSATCSAPSKNVVNIGFGATSSSYRWKSTVPSYMPSAFDAEAEGDADDARRIRRGRR